MEAAGDSSEQESSSESEEAAGKRRKRQYPFCTGGDFKAEAQRWQVPAHGLQSRMPCVPAQ
eukprot:669552-Pelagomonas_calceolata.AAC.1